MGRAHIDSRTRWRASDVTEVIGGAGVPELHFPEPFNVAPYFVDRHLAEGRGGKTALRTREREVSYAELLQSTNRFGNRLRELGIGPGERVLMVIRDCPEFFFLFWGAIKAGIIPVPLNTMLRARDFAFIIRDSGCAALVYSPEFAAEVERALAETDGQPRVALRVEGREDAFDACAAHASVELAAVPTRAEDDCFWLYSSGTTGQPKGVIHAHRDLVVTSWRYGIETLDAEESDVFFSVPRLFFSYGLGISMTFPLWVGASAILDDRRPTPETVSELFQRFAPTVFAAVPTFYAAMLADGLPTREQAVRLRRCISGGEATPAELQHRWRERTGVPIIEGIGSTEVLHIYIGSRIDDRRPGAVGKPVRGYQVKILDETGHEITDEAPGRLWVKGQSITRGYWNNPGKTASAIVDGWLDTGDTFRRDKDGYYVYCGRSDDMLKVAGRWVAPFEIESVLVQHPSVNEAAIVGRADENGLVKIAAWIVLREAGKASEATADEIRAFCKSRLAPYKYPRWITFVERLPKTATGKVQRYKLRTADQDPTGGA